MLWCGVAAVYKHTTTVDAHGQALHFSRIASRLPPHNCSYANALFNLLCAVCLPDPSTHLTTSTLQHTRLAPLPSSKAKTVRDVLSEGLAFLDEGK